MYYIFKPATKEITGPHNAHWMINLHEDVDFIYETINNRYKTTNIADNTRWDFLTKDEVPVEFVAWIDLLT